MAKVSYWEWLLVATVSICVSLLWLLLFQSQVCVFVCLFGIFFLSFSFPSLLGEEIDQKKQPTNKVKSTNEDGERNRKGRRKKEGRQVQFSLQTYRIVGAVWRCSSASIESEFLLLNSIQRYHNLKRLLLPRGFQMKPSERDFWNARSDNCRFDNMGPVKAPLSGQTSCLHNPSTHPIEVKTFPLLDFLFLSRWRVKATIIILKIFTKPSHALTSKM